MNVQFLKLITKLNLILKSYSHIKKYRDVTHEQKKNPKIIILHHYSNLIYKNPSPYFGLPLNGSNILYEDYKKP